jgi:hypothetical protein
MRQVREKNVWVTHYVLNSSEFLTGVSCKHVSRATSSSACAHLALCAFLLLPRRSQALKTAEELSARRTAVRSSRIMILVQRDPARFAWLLCRS